MPAVPKHLMSLIEASGALDFRLQPTNASNWLADTRRKTTHYRCRGVAPPKAVKHNGVWHYPREEIERWCAQFDALI